MKHIAELWNTDFTDYFPRIESNLCNQNNLAVQTEKQDVKTAHIRRHVQE